MLTSDLVRVRMRKGEVRPQYLDPADPTHLALAGSLIELYQHHVGHSRGEIEEALAEQIGEGTDFVLYRGLSRLLAQRGTFEVDAPCDPIELRRAVFERAASVHPVALREGDLVHPVSRAQVLAEVAAAMEIDPARVERALYADLEHAHLLTTFATLDAPSLLHRYNTALAQAVLLKATSLTITIAPGDPARYRQLFRYIKFFRLMHGVAGSAAEGYRLTLDGPMSLFHQSSRYGVQMAEFLPALLLCEGWSLEAALQWGRDRKPATFALDPGMGLRSHYPDHGVYVTDEERFFVERFAKLGGAWTLEKRPEIVDLGGRGVLIPDFVIRHAEDGREALFEIVGFWRKGYLEARLELLKAHGPAHLVLAVSERFHAARETLEALAGPVVYFKDVIPTREVLEHVERVARTTLPPKKKRKKR